MYCGDSGKLKSRESPRKSTVTVLEKTMMANGTFTEL